MNDYTNIGEVIKYLRKKAKLSQLSLSEGICSREYLGKIERGECSPTFEIVNLLSNKLGINIYDNYALVLEHHGIQTHQKIEKINDLIYRKDFLTLHSYVGEISKLKTFSFGIPFKIIQYSEVLYYGQCLHDYTKATNIALKGLESDKESILTKSPLEINLSSADLLLMQSIAVNLCRQNQLKLAEKYYDFIYEYLKNSLTAKRYVINRNMRFELNILAHVIYNKYIFLHGATNKDYEKITSIIELLNSFNVSNMMPELLFCKAKIEFDLGKKDLSAKTIVVARCLAKFFYNNERAIDLEKEICNSDFIS